MDVCPFCSCVALDDLHGHRQCQQCHRVIESCCEGECAQPEKEIEVTCFVEE